MTLHPDRPLDCDTALAWLEQTLEEDTDQELEIDALLARATAGDWSSEAEFLQFFKAISIAVAESACQDPETETAALFDRDVSASLYLGSPFFALWQKALATKHPLLQQAIDISGWESDLDPSLEELPLLMLLPLAFTYEQPLFAALRNRVLPELSKDEEEFMIWVVTCLQPGSFDGTYPQEISLVPSARVLVELLEDWRLHEAIWSPEWIGQILQSPYASQEVKDQIALVLKGEDPNDPQAWQEFAAEQWSEVDMAKALHHCEA